MIEINNILDLKFHLNEIKIIILDLDDTLYSEKEYVKSGYTAVAKALPQIKNAKIKLWDAFENKKSAIDEVLISEGIYTEDLKQKCLDIYRNHIPDIQFYDGVRDLLIRLKNADYKIGVITDGRPNGQWAKIKALDLEKIVDKIIVTDELGGIEYRKPNKVAFVKMREYFGVNYNEMCYVGDNVAKDFIATELLGIRSIYFKNQDGLYYKK